MSSELGKKLVLQCSYEPLFGNKFKQALTKSFFWVFGIFYAEK
jgi:hypothetical protein